MFKKKKIRRENTERVVNSISYKDGVLFIGDNMMKVDVDAMTFVGNIGASLVIQQRDSGKVDIDAITFVEDAAGTLIIKKSDWQKITLNYKNVTAWLIKKKVIEVLFPEEKEEKENNEKNNTNKQ